MGNCKHIGGWALTNPDELLKKIYLKRFFYLQTLPLLLDNNIYIPIPSGFFPNSYEKSFLGSKIFT